MSVKVFISPNYYGKSASADNGGIRRVVEAELKYLPQFGVESVANIQDADVIQNHGAMQDFHKTTPILHTGHGLYWSRQPWDAGYQEVNEMVVDAMVRAQAHTAPSQWVANALRRGGYFYPEVVYHGVDSDEFKPSLENEGYVLWNKARADYVSDPGDLMQIASRMPAIPFMTTIGKPLPNLTILGLTEYARMKEVVARAGVYLCTARETFGIGTLEAMACGVPVAGWDWGGQSEIVVNGETGFLAPPGDFQVLSECIYECIAQRDRLSANAREDAKSRWGWEPRIRQYADMIKYLDLVYNRTKRPKVSIIVTAYKLDQYLPQCLDSVTGQEYQDFECLVVDDGNLSSTRVIVESYTRKDKRIRYCPTPENLGLAGARNFGLSKSTGAYIRHLDADDFLASSALTLEAGALDANPGIHIAYGHLEVVREDGSRIIQNGEALRGGWPPEDFSWIGQMAHMNYIPSCVMARREVYEKSGGYRLRMKRNEDAEFWCRVTSLGFRAKKVTQAVTYFHRERDDSKGATEWREEGREKDWTAWFPWRAGADNIEEATRVLRKYAGRHPRPYLVPFGAQGKPDPSGYDSKVKFWYVHDYAYPIVSVIVTCGPGHEKYLVDALDSVQAQTYPDWECIVVNDTGREWDSNIQGAPWARVVNMAGNEGTAAARNEGFKHARGRYVIWLDADDYWTPWLLEVLMAHTERNKGIIFSDVILNKEGKFKVMEYGDFDPAAAARHMVYAGTSVLVPREAMEAVIKLQGGWDEKIVGMEDWDFQLAVHHLGICAYHVRRPLFVYRMETTTKREKDHAKIDEIVEYVNNKWYIYRVEGRPMPCGCGGTKTVNSMPGSMLKSSGDFGVLAEPESAELATRMVVVEYVGPIEENFTIRSRVDRGQTYRFGNNQYNKENTVYYSDVEFLTSLLDGNARPLYRMVSGIGVIEDQDPSAFVGQMVEGA